MITYSILKLQKANYTYEMGFLLSLLGLGQLIHQKLWSSDGFRLLKVIKVLTNFSIFFWLKSMNLFWMISTQLLLDLCHRTKYTFCSYNIRTRIHFFSTSGRWSLTTRQMEFLLLMEASKNILSKFYFKPGIFVMCKLNFIRVHCIRQL